MKTVLTILLAALAAVPALAQSVEQRTRLEEIQRVSSIAYLDFCKHLAKDDPTVSEDAKFLSDVFNYNMTIYPEDKGKYVVVFSPKMLRGEAFFGTIKYDIDAKSRKILKFSLVK